jgi:hypothetical protein
LPSSLKIRIFEVKNPESWQNGPANSAGFRPAMRDSTIASVLESWQNGYCTSLENWRPQGLGGSNPSLSALLLCFVSRQ